MFADEHLGSDVELAAAKHGKGMRGDSEELKKITCGLLFNAKNKDNKKKCGDYQE